MHLPEIRQLKIRAFVATPSDEQSESKKNIRTSKK